MATNSSEGPAGHTADGHIEVVNWDEYQHYKDRDPPWIKLYNSLIEDPDFMRLQPASRWLAVGLFLLASRTDNRIPLDGDFLRWRLKLPDRPDLSPLQDAGLIRVVQDDSAALANGKRDATTEGETEREGEEETEQTWGTPEEWPSPGSLPKEGGRIQYPNEFEQMWEDRIRRDGKNPKKRGYRMYRKARQGGMERDEAELALEMRRREANRKDENGKRYVEQFATFFGQDDVWREYVENPDPADVAEVDQATRDMLRKRAQREGESLQEVDLPF